MDLTSIRDITTPQTGTGATAAVTKPSNGTTGDLILVWLAEEDLGGAVTLPTGFSTLLTLNVASGMSGRICGKVYTGSEPATYDFTIGSSRTGWAAHAALITGSLVDLSSFPSSAIRDSDVANNTGTSVTVPELTLLGAGDLLLGFVASRGTGAAITSNGSVMTALWTTQAFGSRGERAFHQEGVTGSTGTRVFDVAASTVHTAGLLALKAAGTAQTATNRRRREFMSYAAMAAPALEAFSRIFTRSKSGLMIPQGA